MQSEQIKLEVRRIDSVKKKRVRIESRDPQTLSEGDIESMFIIYSRHHNMDYERFRERTKSQFSYIGIFKERDSGHIIGFMGYRYEKIHIPKIDKSFHTLYSGQFFVIPEYRSRSFMHIFSMKQFLYWKFKHFFSPLIIWGDAITHKSYLLVCHSLRHSFPQPGMPLPEDLSMLMDEIGKHFYGDRYEMGTGIVHKDERRVKEHELVISERDLEDPLVKFYVEVNPGYKNGDGLLLIIPFNLKNFFSVITHQLGRVYRRYRRSLKR